MAVFNEQATITQSVKSIINQSYLDWEMIIIDDHSTDNTFQLLSELAKKDNRISVLRNEKNIGLAKSLNIGLKKNNSELIARMDGDDISKPSRLEKQVSFMLANPDIDVLGTGAELIEDDETVVGSAFLPQEHESIKKVILKKSVFFHPSVMMRNSFVQTAGGYNEKLKRSQDYELWVRGLSCGAQYQNLNEVLISYRTSIYSKSLKTLVSEFYSRMYTMITHGYYIKGVLYALIDFLKNILIHYHIYKPISMREKI